MSHYSRRSKDRLATADADLQALFNSIVPDFDNTILYGHRTPAEQYELWERGRVLVNGVWVVENVLEVVTYKDGFDRLSKHNFSPSLAVDAVPYPIDWKDENRMCYFAGMVMERARAMGLNIRWLGDGDQDTQLADERFMDLPHFELMP